ncbi:MAG TPA: ribonuclease T [Thermopetrobacter sp.]|nr:ribonuclease T [Thermopetrobacter sp.]
MRWLLIWLSSALAALADGERAGDFDYYVLSLSWSPNWCATTGAAQGAEQCGARRDLGWTLHGLWPQYERGWPAFCRTPHAPPSRRMTRDMADIMGSAGLAWYQWKKHGTCSGLSAADYFALSRRAYEQLRRPEIFRRLDRAVRLPAAVVEEAFLRANPGLSGDMIAITCRDGRIAELRVCLSRTLAPVPCGRETGRDCRLKDALLAPMR